MNATYLSVADTAKLVRAALKRAFPRTKFSVRSDSYAGGASIRVSWADGPAARMVEAVTGQFAGGGFDGSIDMAYSKYHWLLADGSAVMASNPGTQGSAGSHAAERNWMPSPDAKLVRFGADFVFVEREMSAALLRRAVARVAAQGHSVADVVVRDGYRGGIVEAPDHVIERTVMRAAIRTHIAA